MPMQCWRSAPKPTVGWNNPPQGSDGFHLRHHRAGLPNRSLATTRLAAGIYVRSASAFDLSLVSQAAPGHSRDETDRSRGESAFWRVESEYMVGNLQLLA